MHDAEHLDMESQSAARASRPGGRLLLLLAGGLPAAASLLAYGGKWWWGLDLLSHFRFQYLVILLVTTLLCLLTRRWGWMLAFAVALGVNVYSVAELYRPIDPRQNEHRLAWLTPWSMLSQSDVPAGDGAETDVQQDSAESDEQQAASPLRLVSLRAPSQPQLRHAMNDLLASSDADVVVLFNITEAIMHHVHYNSSPFFGRVAEPREDGFGLAVLTRGGHHAAVSLVDHELVMLAPGPAQVPAVSLQLDYDEQTLAMLVVRLTPPVNREDAWAHRQQVDGIIRWVRNQDGPAVVVTDFSATPWSAGFRDLLDRAGLVNSQRGFGVQATWPSTGGPLGKLPIDHLLHTPDLLTLRRVLGPSLGGDRHTLFYTLTWASLNDTTPNQAADEAGDSDEPSDDDDHAT